MGAPGRSGSLLLRRWSGAASSLGRRSLIHSPTVIGAVQELAARAIAWKGLKELERIARALAGIVRADELTMSISLRPRGCRVSRCHLRARRFCPTLAYTCTIKRRKASRGGVGRIPAPPLQRLPAAMPSDLKFRFSLEKFVNALAYFATSGVQDLTKLKALKLLYLADQYHLLRFGRPITGDRYIAMDYGPVPEGAFQLITLLVEPAEVDDPARDRVHQQLLVYRGLLHQYRYPVLRARRKADLDVFSDSEVEALAATVRDFGKRQARALVDLTHEHRAYKLVDAGRPPGSSVELPYKYFFEDAPENLKHVRALAEAEQEDRNFADELRTAGRAALDAHEKPT